jgi:hypothetical protein
VPENNFLGHRKDEARGSVQKVPAKGLFVIMSCPVRDAAFEVIYSLLLILGNDFAFMEFR